MTNKTQKLNIKFLLGICIVFMSSCNSKEDFYVGKWYINNENNTIIEIKEDSTISWFIGDYEFLDNSPFKIINKSDNYAKFEFNIGEGHLWGISIKPCSKNNNQCLITTYKSHINKEMIDEVFLVNRFDEPIENIEKPQKQKIILPDSLKGEFYIIYGNEKNKQSEIQINTRGVGCSKGKLDVLQLYNTNREFCFKDSNKKIKILNPNNYLNIADSCITDNDFVVIQHGFNQMGRKRWNKANGMIVGDNLNIEFFELVRKNAR